VPGAFADPSGNSDNAERATTAKTACATRSFKGILCDMSESESVICGMHGETPATFACRHVVEGVACGFHSSSDDPEDLWPDAWCDLCDELLRAEGGEWNDVAEQRADVKLLCTRCYEVARELNVRAPRYTRGAARQLTKDEISSLVHHAVHEMQAIQAAAEDRWGLGTMARWDFDDEASTLTFSDPDHPTVVADIRLVGSYSLRSRTFQWAWRTLEGTGKTSPVSRLRVFGEVRAIPELTTPCWECEEQAGWEMSALAGYVLGADGIYRAPFEHQRWFMLLSNLRTHLN
jgi:hypothetical protein